MTSSTLSANDNGTTTPVLTFKSDRAARIAFGKAERAWEETREPARFAGDEARKAGKSYEEAQEILEKAQRIERAAYAKAAGIYNAAREQGIWIRSYEFNYSATKELIAMNID